MKKIYEPSVRGTVAGVLEGVAWTSIAIGIVAVVMAVAGPGKPTGDGLLVGASAALAGTMLLATAELLRRLREIENELKKR